MEAASAHGVKAYNTRMPRNVTLYNNDKNNAAIGWKGMVRREGEREARTCDILF